jgi:AcrR family transcriptional regulator
MSSLPPPASQRRPTGTLDEATVLEMAVRVLEEDGIDHLSLARVARRLGVTQPALYRHVGGFDRLLRRLALEGRVRLRSALTDAAVGRSGDGAVSAVAGAWRKFAHDHPQLYAATDRSPLAGDADNEAAAAAIVRLLTNVISGFGLEDAEAERAAWALRSALHGFVVLENGSGNPASFELDATFDRLVALLVAGLGRWAAFVPTE